MINQYISESSNLILHGNLNSNKIALTYDCDELEHVYISEILNALKKHNIKSTFFITGHWAQKFSELAKRIASEGHQIGNHSYEHPDITTISYDEIKQSIIKAEETIKKITGVNPRPFFRPPYGSWSNLALKALGEAGYLYTIYWSIDTQDWQQPSTKLIVKRIFENVKGGHIILMHSHGKNTAAATDFTVETLKTFGLKFVTISELLK